MAEGDKGDKGQFLGPEDGWYKVPNHPQLHYFWKGHSLCGLYKNFPDTATMQNVPLLQCQNCKQTVNKLMSVASSIAGKKLNARQVFNLIEALEKIDLKKGAQMKVKTGENVVACIGHSDNTKTTLVKKETPSKKVKSH